MNIKSCPYNNVNFGARNEHIRNADEVQRTAKRAFPSFSYTLAEDTYLSVHNKKEGKNICGHIREKLEAIRDIRKNREQYLFANPDNVPYINHLRDVKLHKLANCEECSVVSLAALAANGFYDAKRANLGLEIRFIKKPQNAQEAEKTEQEREEYNEIAPLDHSFVVSTMQKNDTQGKSYYVIDNWLGFSDSVSGAKGRYKQIYDEEQFNSLIKFHKSMFRADKAEQTGKIINFDDYDIKTSLVFFRVDDYTPEDIARLGEYAKMKYPELVIKDKHK